MRGLLTVGMSSVLGITPAAAQDMMTVDSQHVKIVAETPRVRVLRYRYEAHGHAPMHSHPDAVDIVLTDGDVRLTLPNGRAIEHHVKVGDVHVNPPGSHRVDNLGDTPFEGILVELKKSPAPPAGPGNQQSGAE